MNKRTFLRRILSVVMTLSVFMTIIPAVSGDLAVHAATAKAPAQVKGLAAKASGQTKVSISWTKIAKNKNVKGYTVYRNGKAIKSVGKSTSSFTDSGLKAGTKYTYTVRAYNTYKQYYNSKTKKWVNKKPKKKFWVGKKTRTAYKYGSAAASKSATTSKPAAASTASTSGSKTSATSSSKSSSASSSTASTAGSSSKTSSGSSSSSTTSGKKVTVYDGIGRAWECYENDAVYNNPRFNVEKDGWFDGTESSNYYQRNGVVLSICGRR